jgi:hypothetical protein
MINRARSALHRQEQAQRHQEIVVIEVKTDVNPVVSGRLYAESFRNPDTSITHMDGQVAANVRAYVVCRHAVMI